MKRTYQFLYIASVVWIFFFHVNIEEAHLRSLPLENTYSVYDIYFEWKEIRVVFYMISWGSGCFACFTYPAMHFLYSIRKVPISVLFLINGLLLFFTTQTLWYFLDKSFWLCQPFLLRFGADHNRTAFLTLGPHCFFILCLIFSNSFLDTVVSSAWRSFLSITLKHMTSLYTLSILLISLANCLIYWRSSEQTHVYIWYLAL